MATIPMPAPKTQSPRGPAILALGFRPFFLGAGLAAIGLIGVWLGAWTGHYALPGYYGPAGWHSHEMLFGYAVAVIAGFLLTAVGNWTGFDTLSGPPLGVLTALWLLARLLPLVPGNGLPVLLLPLVDLAFLPLLALALGIPLLRSGQRNNYVFLPLLGGMALANLLVHLEALGISHTASRGQGLMINLILLLLVIVAGRVVPFFTERGIPGAKARRYPLLERVGFGLLLALAAAELLYPAPWLAAPLSLALALVHGLRLGGWHDRRAWALPILWVLYTGYAWLALGFLLHALGSAGLIAPSHALHALTIGAIGVLTLGMMSRVTLGHTGRDLRTTSAMTLAFVLLNLAATARALGPMLAPQSYLQWIQISGGLWTLAFALFVLVYAPMLASPRADGRPG